MDLNEWRLPKAKMIVYTVLIALFGLVFSNEQEKYKLPGNLVPHHYRLEILTLLEESSYKGDVWITIECKEVTNEIILHSEGLIIKDTTISRLSKEKENENELEVTKTRLDEKNNYLIIELGENLQEGIFYLVHLSFEGMFSSADKGLFKANYKDEGITRWYAVTNFKTGARGTFPCFDEPGLSSPFDIGIGHEETLNVISNMPSTNIAKGHLGYTWHYFSTTPPISPQQVAFVVCDLQAQEVTQPDNHIPLVVWARPAKLTKLMSTNPYPGKVITFLPKFLDFFKSFFSIDCPVPKVNLVAIPGSGYVANLGIIMDTEERLLRSADLQEANRIAHDVAGLWLNGLVSIQWWNDVWYPWALQEYLALLAMDEVFPSWNIANRVVVSRLESTYREDNGDQTVHASDVKGPHDVYGKYFTDLFFDKDPLLIRMLHLILGDEAFKLGLTKYLTKYQAKSANHKDLWECLTSAGHETLALPSELSVNQIMHTWISQGGYPLVTVTRDYVTGTVTVTQKRFHNTKPEANDGMCWWIPLSYSSATEPHFIETTSKHWLSCQQPEVTISIDAKESEWIIFNNRLTGILRVNYDDDNWIAIAIALHKPEFSEIDELNRAQIVMDALDLAEAKILNYKIAFNVVNYLRQENNYLPWKVALVRLREIKNMLYETSEYGVFKAYMWNLLSPMLEKFEDLEGTGVEDKLKRSIIMRWACEFDKEQSSKLIKSRNRSHKEYDNGKHSSFELLEEDSSKKETFSRLEDLCDQKFEFILEEDEELENAVDFDLKKELWLKENYTPIVEALQEIVHFYLY